METNSHSVLPSSKVRKTRTHPAVPAPLRRRGFPKKPKSSATSEVGGRWTENGAELLKEGGPLTPNGVGFQRGSWRAGLSRHSAKRAGGSRSNEQKGIRLFGNTSPPPLKLWRNSLRNSCCSLRRLVHRAGWNGEPVLRSPHPRRHRTGQNGEKRKFVVNQIPHNCLEKLSACFQ